MADKLNTAYATVSRAYAIANEVMSNGGGGGDVEHANTANYAITANTANYAATANVSNLAQSAASAQNANYALNANYANYANVANSATPLHITFDFENPDDEGNVYSNISVAQAANAFISGRTVQLYIGPEQYAGLHHSAYQIIACEETSTDVWTCFGFTSGGVVEEIPSAIPEGASEAYFYFNIS